MGEGGGELEDFGLNNSLHVVKANRKGDGVTVRRGHLAGAATPSFNRLSSPAEAGEGGVDPDSKLVKDFLGDTILLSFLPGT